MHARRVSVLLHRYIPFACIKVETDSEGRYVSLLCTIYTCTVILVATYIPPPYSGEALKKVLWAVGTDNLLLYLHSVDYLVRSILHHLHILVRLALSGVCFPEVCVAYMPFGSN